MKCMTSPVLAFADFEKPFLLETDASKEGSGRSSLSEAGRWPLPPRRLRKLHLTWRRKELPLIEARVPGFEVGHHGAVP